MMKYIPEKKQFIKVIQPNQECQIPASEKHRRRDEYKGLSPTYVNMHIV